MKKFYFTLGLFICLSLPAASQEELYQFTHAYFRSDPFNGEFSSFLDHLLKDPTIKEKKMRLRTDTSLFYFYGWYTNYNPFFFRPARVEVSLEEVPVQYVDSLPGDTLLIYQLTAYAEPGEKGLKEVIKEFEKIHRKYNRRFFDSNYKEFDKNSNLTGAIHNYFVAFHGLAPLSVAWGNTERGKEPALNITLRMKTSENRTVLPVPLYHP